MAGTYLQIAEQVLLKVRRPLTARAILRQAYLDRIVPGRLFGKTQYKTLQARLSEDIVLRRDHSQFFRTKPGYFFLRNFLTDESIPGEFRIPMTARRRTRDLLRGPALAFAAPALAGLDIAAPSGDHPALLKSLIQDGLFAYLDPKAEAENGSQSQTILLWAVAYVLRGNTILCYRAGRYREDRDPFVRRRTVAFRTLVTEDDHTIFDASDLGIAETAFYAAMTDLDVAWSPGSFESFRRAIRGVAVEHPAEGPSSVLAFVEVAPPSWFEPTSRRLSLNDLQWLDLSQLMNNTDDFDPWSKMLLERLFRGISHSRGNSWLEGISPPRKSGT